MAESDDASCGDGQPPMDGSTFESYYVAHFPWLRRKVSKLIASPSEIEDVCAAVFEKALVKGAYLVVRR